MCGLAGEIAPTHPLGAVTLTVTLRFCIAATIVFCLALTLRSGLGVRLIKLDTFSSGRPKLRTLVRTPYARVLVSKLRAFISPAYCSENVALF